MALRNQPYLPLFVDDYLTDEKLNMCSAAAQGVYIKILCILHKSDEYGKLMLKAKYKQNESMIKNFAFQLSKLITFAESEIESALTELIDEKVMSIDGDILYQKRMVRDSDTSLKRSIAGAKGGKKTRENLKIDKQSSSKNQTNQIANQVANQTAKQVANSGNGIGIGIGNVNSINSFNRLEVNETKYSNDFEKFWSTYPKKIGKGGAYKVWRKLKPNKELQERIIEAVERQKKSEQWRREGGRYIPNPQTWLNQARWDDEIGEIGEAKYGID